MARIREGQTSSSFWLKFTLHVVARPANTKSDACRQLHLVRRHDAKLTAVGTVLPGMHLGPTWALVHSMQIMPRQLTHTHLYITHAGIQVVGPR